MPEPPRALRPAAWGACSWWTLGFGEALWEWTLGEVTWGLQVSICMKKGEYLLI